MCETLLNQLRSGTIACSFVQVTMKYVQNCQLAIVTYGQSNQSLWKWIVIRDESLHQTVSLQVGGAYSYDCSFGYIPNVELMKFISLATFGSYLPSCPEVDLSSPEMNIYHRALLTYSFLKTPESMNSEYFCGTSVYHYCYITVGFAKELNKSHLLLKWDLLTCLMRSLN